jgi:hypothetical protein
VSSQHNDLFAIMQRVTVRPSDFTIRFEAEQRAFVCIHTSIRDSTIRHILVVHGRDHVTPRVHRDVAAKMIAVPIWPFRLGGSLSPGVRPPRDAIRQAVIQMLSTRPLSFWTSPCAVARIPRP